MCIIGLEHYGENDVFRKTLEELLEMLSSYEDILGKDRIDKIETCRKENDPQKLKKMIAEAFKRVTSDTTRQLPLRLY